MSTIRDSMPSARQYATAFAFTVSLALAPPAEAQEMDHSKMDHSTMPKPAAPTKSPARTKKSEKPGPAKPEPAPEAVEQTGEDGAIDHAAMGHQPAPEAVDHAAMGHEMPAPEAVDHAAMGHEMPAEDHAAMGHGSPAPAEPREPIPAVTQADRQAAFPPVLGHAAHDRATHSFWLVDRLEASDLGEGSALAWEGLGWAGGDIHRLWLRTEGELESGDLESGEFEALYGRSVSAWWDLVVGVRHDLGEGPSQTFAALGLMGLSPYKFEIDATAYIGQSGQTAVRLEAEYDTLLTNRWILQWQAEVELFGKDDVLRGVGSGLSTAEAGLRLRYEVTRQFAPYVGVVWQRAYGGTADFRRAGDQATSDTRLVAGFRIWF